MEKEQDEQDKDSDDYFGGFRRMATMPVHSVFKNNDKLNFDEIESCKISGMSSSIKEASGEEGS